MLLLDEFKTEETCCPLSTQLLEWGRSQAKKKIQAWKSFQDFKTFPTPDQNFKKQKVRKEKDKKEKDKEGKKGIKASFSETVRITGQPGWSARG